MIPEEEKVKGEDNIFVYIRNDLSIRKKETSIPALGHILITLFKCKSPWIASVLSEIAIKVDGAHYAHGF